MSFADINWRKWQPEPPMVDMVRARYERWSEEVSGLPGTKIVPAEYILGDYPLGGRSANEVLFEILDDDSAFDAISCITISNEGWLKEFAPEQVDESAERVLAQLHSSFVIGKRNPKAGLPA